MESGISSISDGENTRSDWLTGVLFLSDSAFYNTKKLRQWQGYFSELIVAGKGEAPQSLPEGVRWYQYDAESSRSKVWNTITEKVTGSWALFLEDDEQLQFSSFPNAQSLDKTEWAPAIINIQRNSTTHHYYQMRLVNVSMDEGHIFQGHQLADATEFVRSNKINLSSKPIIIERDTSLYSHIDIEEELSLKKQAPKLYLVQGNRYLKAKKYVRASAQFRQLLKQEKLLPFDRLAAVNGLASCLAEQHKWERALSLCTQSLEAESLQRLPYLIQFRIHELRKQWQRAFEVLKQYYDRLALFSGASFDRKIDEEKTFVNLANVALKAGRRAKANEYFDKLFTFKRGNSDRAMLEKALMLSIELDDFERSTYLFEQMFGDQLPPNEMEEGIREEIDEVMTLFMTQNWYGYVSTVYKKLYDAHPGDQVYKRKLIVSLTKTNRLEQAKKMVANII
ncbi:tetratricopeptide repeat protein [Fodinibius salsisoli]|uniref:Tetratricopeptide repeat protein n=1 Tax=Fodinibius salsisoli TaxID=2820877 RepID=A0ABT3PHE9_9BACT|nr:tetratricopeptide repeat protein [Fodinibius salsisoli]MCW9705349.1 tetratricopeptide repeat protein [Fodinibius salsisoli]